MLTKNIIATYDAVQIMPLACAASSITMMEFVSNLTNTQLLCIAICVLN